MYGARVGEGEKKRGTENNKVRRCLKERGWLYIDGVVVLRRQENQAKAARIQRDPQSGILYTTMGGRRWWATDERCEWEPFL